MVSPSPRWWICSSQSVQQATNVSPKPLGISFGQGIAPRISLASTLVVDFRVDPQGRAAVWLRWPSAQSAKVELQDFNLERERTDDRREISAGRATGEGWRERFSASRSRGRAAIADGNRRRGADRGGGLRGERGAGH